MSIARKCDRCKTYHDGSIYKVNIYRVFNFDSYEVEYDLCQDCKIEYDAFMDGAKPETLLDRLKSMHKKGE